MRARLFLHGSLNFDYLGWLQIFVRITIFFTEHRSLLHKFYLVEDVDDMEDNDEEKGEACGKLKEVFSVFRPGDELNGSRPWTGCE